MIRARVARQAAVLLCVAAAAAAQTTTGGVAGIVRDASGAVVAGVDVTVASEDTGLERRVVTDQGGRYAAPLLGAGRYVVRGAARGLRAQGRRVLVQAGMSATVDLVLDVASVSETVTVSGGDRLRFDHHQVGGWVDRAAMEHQPLNGRTVLELVKLEPGVLVPERLPGGRVFIAPLGAGLQTIPRVGFTRITLDGASIETPGTVGTLLQVSPDVVDQLQVSTANFDGSVGLATSGAVNVVTRSGGNDVRGSAFSLYRDRSWSALAAADPAGAPSQDPAFRRHQLGGVIGGPLRRDRLFVFAGVERHDQRDVIHVRPESPEFAAFGGTFVSPYSGTLFNGRLDARLSDRHRAFLRHTHDANEAFTTSGAVSRQLPSAWSERPVRVHQTLASWTSVLTPALVSDLHVSYYRTDIAQRPATADRCPPPCFGLGSPRVLISDGGPAGLVIGRSPSLASVGRRLQVSGSLVWHRGAHLVRFGFDWERTTHALVARDSDPVQMTLWSPGAVRQRAPSLALPSSFETLEDIYRLPLLGFTTSVGPGEVLQRGFEATRRIDMLRLHVGDQWRIGSRLTVNGGVAWSYEPGVLNHDLVKPAWLAPLVGDAGLRVPATHANLSAMLGVAWKPTADGRTVVRGGAGRYFESVARTVALNLANERLLLSPLGIGRLVASGAGIFVDGRPLRFGQPTAFSGADLLAMLPDIRGAIAASLDPENRDFSVVNLDLIKEGDNLYDPSYTTPRAVHVSAGVQHDAGGGLVVAADVTWKRFAHTFINGIDYNRYFSDDGPVIPGCAPGQEADVTAACSNGSLRFDTTSGRARYLGLLLRAEQRLAGRGRVVASYALGSFVGSNGTGEGTSEAPGGRVFGFNNDDWSENHGPLPTDYRHVLNVAGSLSLPWRLDLSFNLSATGRAPFSAYVAGMDFNGDGTVNDLLPGTRVNEFNRGLGRGDLVGLVEAYNDTYAGRLTAGGQPAPFVTLPDDFAFNDRFFTLDVRIGRAVDLGSSLRLTAFVDVFNVLDTVNYTGYSGNLASPAFGQPGGRIGQAFGPGGPRAAQAGLRMSF